MSDWFENACCRMSGRPEETASFGQRFTAAGGRWLRMIFMPFAFLIDHFGLWLRLSLLYALVLSLLSWGLGYLYVCAGTAETAGFYCRNSVPVYLLYLFCGLRFWACFAPSGLRLLPEKKFFVAADCPAGCSVLAHGRIAAGFGRINGLPCRFF